MEGFIRNETGRAVFKLQRPLPPGSVLKLEDAYMIVGEKSGKNRGMAFVKWLKENVFREEGWVFYKEEGVPYSVGSQAKKARKVNSSRVEKSVSEEEKVDGVAAGGEPVEEASPKKERVSPSRGAGRRLVRKNKKISKNNNTAASIIDADAAQARRIVSKVKDRSVLKKALALSNHFANKEEHRRLIQRRLEEVY
ncbi:MAG: hypothetical protein GF334_01605 [Candidatus Altiarchaeales archaeon]|nr:hypothetical protein [Candidatus Altiarchaeales archaeon]